MDAPSAPPLESELCSPIPKGRIASGCYRSRMSSFLELTVLDIAGAKHPLSELARGKPLVVVFLRHFG